MAIPPTPLPEMTTTQCAVPVFRQNAEVGGQELALTGY